MTEAAFRSWVRSQLRRMSMRWRPIGACKKRVKVDATPLDKKRWGNLIRVIFPCEICEDRVTSKGGQVDHIVPCGSLLDIEKDAGPFLLRLLVEHEGLMWVCNTCHLVKTAEEKAERILQNA